MLIKLTYLINKYNLRIKGIIHAGAHWAEEHGDYVTSGVENVIYIEPSEKAFQILLERFKEHLNVGLFKKALSDKEGIEQAYCETVNDGQSNSLLKPKNHLKQYPNIIFDGTETWYVTTLDNLEFDRTKYNFLNADIQGNELAMFRGAKETLKHIDYIFCEVNKEEVYEGCGQVEQLDSFLGEYGFKRVETVWAGGSWGDAFYIKEVVQWY